MATGDALKSLKKWTDAISLYSQAIVIFKTQSQSDPSQSSQVIQAILKRGLAYYNSRKYSQALEDFRQVILKEKS
jgi:tetratricopeptide (TPR) repeat protein